jgi:hypothetical protein
MNQFTTSLGPQQGCDELNGRFADLYAGWVQADETWTYAGPNSFTIFGDKTGKYQKGDKIKFAQSQAYSNAPISGSNIELNMNDTSGFKIGNVITVSSSAGSEQTTVAAINVGVSITATNLMLDHTTINPLVTCVKHAYLTGINYSAPNTTFTINLGPNFVMANAALANNYYSKAANPQGIQGWMDNGLATVDGWIDPCVAWTYASSTAFTAPGDWTGIHQKGDKIKLTQTTVKYFYLTAISYASETGLTTYTINGGSDYSLTDVEITDNYYSKTENPRGFPDWFNFTCIQAGFSANPTNAVYRFKIQGNHCIAIVHQGVNGTSNSTSFSMTAPVTAKTLTNMVWEVLAYSYDNGAMINNSVASITSAGTSFVLSKGGSPTGWTGSAGKRASFEISYEI